jgi:pteridine reductase
MSATSLAGRIALVTGGAHRVGKAIVMALAAEGMRLAVHYHGAADAADATVRELQAMGVDARAVSADLRDSEAPARLIDDVVHACGGLDLLVNSAAVMRRTPIGEVTAAAWDTMFALNLRAPFLLSQAACPHLARAKSGATGGTGAIVNIADLAAFETWPDYVPHSITKAGIVQMTRGLAHALAPDVRVNAVAPGAVLLPDDWSAEAAAHFADTTPLKRLGSPDDVGQAVVYLARAEYVTGETIVVDGGRRVRT